MKNLYHHLLQQNIHDQHLLHLNVQRNQGLEKDLIKMIVEEDVVALKDYLNAGHSLNTFAMNATVSPLIFSIIGQHKKATRFMLKNGVDIDNCKGWHGHLVDALVQYRMSDLLTLAFKRGAKFDQADRNGYTALHISVSNGEDDVSLFLLQHGADPHKNSTIGDKASAVEWMKEEPENFPKSLKFIRAKEEFSLLNDDTPIPQKIGPLRRM